LHYKIADDAAIIRIHSWAVRIKYTHYLYLKRMLPPVIEKERLGAAFAFVVAASYANRVNFSPVPFGLRMNLRITVNLGCRCLQYPRTQAFREPEHVDRTVDASFYGLNGVFLILHWRCGACQIKYLIDLDIEREGNIMTEKFEIRISKQVLDILLGTGE
jgi:hypothetical protein